jgi:hypothetical protein
MHVIYLFWKECLRFALVFNLDFWSTTFRDDLQGNTDVHMLKCIRFQLRISIL